jgi:hypothetical protein
MWKVNDNNNTVDKLCNQCFQIIDTFQSDHPITQQLITLDDEQIQKLQFGLENYHFHPISNKYPNCVVPYIEPRILSPEEQQKQQAELDKITHKTTEPAKQKLFKLPTNPQKVRPLIKHLKRGRPSTSKLKAEMQALSEQLDKAIEDANGK